MLKKLLTGCLTIAAAAALAVPAMAADMSGKVGGRAAADIISYSMSPGTSGAKSVSYMDMQSEGRLDYTLTSTEGDWTATGKVELRSNAGTDYNTSPIILQKYFQIENDSVAISLGVKNWGFAYFSPYIGVSGAWDRHCYGCLNYRDDRLVVGIKQVGLQVYYTAKNENTDDSTSDAFTKAEYGVEYKGAFGPVNLAVAYISQSWAALEGITGDDQKKTAKDGKSVTQLALGVAYTIQEGMTAELEYEANSSKNGTSGAKTSTGNYIGLGFNMALSETQGIAVSYDMLTENAGTDGAKDYKTNTLVATFNQKLAGQQLWVAYFSEAKDTGTTKIVTDTTTKIALGGRVSF